MNEDLKAVSVTELNTVIKRIFDNEEMLFSIRVFGEISEYKVVRGTAYFSLKDENALLPCVMFGAVNTVKEGDQVVLTGTPRFYVKGGRLSFNVTKIEPFGQGALFREFLVLKDKLEKEGLFLDSKKKNIPEIIKKIGVVSSETGAVIQDILNVSLRRDPSISIALFPAKVQGEGAEKTIVDGLNYFSDSDVDVVIVARGGGSLEDLHPFNTEIVARAVFECSKPVVSAVGHETDFTICDFVSSLRAPTPSAAAELLTKDKVAKRRDFIKNLKRLEFLSAVFIKDKKSKFDIVLRKLLFSSDNFVKEREFSLGLATNSISKLNPNSIMRLGYSKIEQDGRLVDSVEKFSEEKLFTAFLFDGQIEAKPVKIQKGVKK